MRVLVVNRNSSQYIAQLRQILDGAGLADIKVISEDEIDGISGTDVDFIMVDEMFESPVIADSVRLRQFRKLDAVHEAIRVMDNLKIPDFELPPISFRDQPDLLSLKRSSRKGKSHRRNNRK